MQKKKIILAISVCFYLAMAVLALTSRSVYEAGLPRVHICYLEQMAFWEDGAYSYLPALPKELAGQTLTYVTAEIRNKETHYVVKKADQVVLGAEKNGYYAVISGFSEYFALITESDGVLEEGQEVLVENEEEIIW